MPGQYLLERVDDAAVVQLYADDFERLTREQRVLAWHLGEAALAGRDIYYDQRYRHNLAMRDVLERLLEHPDAMAPDVLERTTRYTKLFWLNTGPFSQLTSRKRTIDVPPEALRRAVHAAAARGAGFPVRRGESLDDLLDRLVPAFCDPDVDPFVTNKTPGQGVDILAASANNLYDGVSVGDLAGFEERYPLNSRLVKRDGRLVEEVWRVGGRYGTTIACVVEHLEAAAACAPGPTRAALEALIRTYRTGEEADRFAYDVAWVADQDAAVDTINGFIEVYMDPRGRKGAWESLVWHVNAGKTASIAAIAGAAQWFEDHMPYAAAYRRDHVRGVTARAIDVIVEAGDSGPMTPIGINLPNDERVRETRGSKSVSLSNVVDAYERSTPAALRREFSWSSEEADRAERWGPFAGELATNLHEVIGHGSGQVAARLRGSPQSFLNEHYSALEETRADLVALYFIADPTLVELGVVQAADREEIVRAEYEGYARNALLQLRRIRQGSQIEEDHMRNRQAIVHWLMAHTSAVDRRSRDGRTYDVVTDCDAFREGVGRLLHEVQRIKSEGDYAAARAFFEQYGIHFDPALRDEIVARVDALDLPSYTGFVMPRLEPVRDGTGVVVDAGVSYPRDLTRQMLEYSSRYRLDDRDREP